MSDRRTKVPFNPYYFEQQAARQKEFSLAEKFGQIYESNHWNAAESVSGEGAEDAQIEQIKIHLPPLIRRLEAKILLDAPCGDFGWLSKIELPVEKYIGADIVSPLIEQNNLKYADAQRSFIVADITRDDLPPADLMLCRDCFVHLSFQDIKSAIANIKRCGIKYLLTTTFTDCEENQDIVSGDWRLLNFEKPPFSFPAPVASINEHCTEGGGIFADKTLGLWLLEEISV